MGIQSKEETWDSLIEDREFATYLSRKIVEDPSLCEKFLSMAVANADLVGVRRRFNSKVREVLFTPKPDPKPDDPAFDPILHEAVDHARYMPIVRFPDIEKMANVAKDLDWTDTEIKYKPGVDGFGDLPETITRTLEEILGFFAGSEGIVIENAVCRFYREIKNYEARLFLTQQFRIEIVHDLSYKALLDKLVKSARRRTELKQALDNHPYIRAKGEWTMKYMDPDLDIAECLVAFAAVEGIGFAGSFCYIFYVKNNYPKVCEPLTQVNELVLRDECLHYMFTCLLYTKLKRGISPEKIREILVSFVELEMKFNAYILPEDVDFDQLAGSKTLAADEARDAANRCMTGMNVHLMNKHVRFIANTIWIMLGQEDYLYPEDTQCPFPFMVQLGLSHLNNFFEVRDNNYRGTKEMVVNPVNHLFEYLTKGSSRSPETKASEPYVKPRASMRMARDKIF